MKITTIDNIKIAFSKTNKDINKHVDEYSVLITPTNEKLKNKTIYNLYSTCLDIKPGFKVPIIISGKPYLPLNDKILLEIEE